MATTGPSTRSLESLPSIDEMIQHCKALAMLDAVLSPEWEYRYYSFNSEWGPGEMMASIRNGSGDEYFILFNKHGAAMKGFDHECVMSPWNSDDGRIWPHMYDKVPAEFSSFLNEPAFSMNDVTFCIWRQYGDSHWHCGVEEFPAGEDPDGSAWMLEMLAADPAQYRQFALDYYSADLPLEAIHQVYKLEPLTDGIVRALNSALSLRAIQADAAEIGYPISAD